MKTEEQTAVTAYPAPPGLVTSPDFTLTANGTEVWVEKITGGGPINVYNHEGIILEDFLPAGLPMEDLNAAGFSCTGPVTISVTAAEDITSYVIRPKSRGIAAQVQGRTLTFTIPGPQKLYVEINSCAHLAIFADAPEADVPAEGDPGVVYYGPGSHSPGTVELASNQTVYLAPGAVVTAEMRGDGLENITITGRGMLNGKVWVSNTTNLQVDGIFVRNTFGCCNGLINCTRSVYRNVKVFGREAVYSTDGINPLSCHGLTIDDCFIRTRDDCVSIKSMKRDQDIDGITISNCVLVGWMCADGVTLGFELNGSPIRNILVKNCDILYARGNGRTGGHAGFGIVCDGPAWVENIRFEDIRVEEQVEYKNLELIVTDGTLYGKGPAGHIQGVYLKDIAWENAGKPLVLAGYGPENLVEDVTFENCRVAGKPLTGLEDADFQVNEFVRNVTFVPEKNR